MRTESDLRAALAAREHLAPAADGVLAGLDHAVTHRPRMRRVGAVAAATLAVAAVAVTPVVLARLSPDPVPVTPAPAAGAFTDPRAADRPPFSMTIAAGVVAGHEIRPDSVDYPPRGQAASIVSVRTGRAVAELYVYGAPTLGLGVAGPGPDQPLDVVGPGEIAATVHDQTAIISATPEASTLRWRYAPDAWAVLRSTPNGPPLPSETLLDIASGVRFVDPYPVRVPFQLDYVPDDLRPFHVAVAGSEALVQFQSTATTVAPERSADITVTLGSPGWPGYETWEWTPTTIAGRPARCAEPGDLSRCEFRFGEVVVLIGAVIDPIELDQLVSGLHLADMGDPATWFDVVVAIPGA